MQKKCVHTKGGFTLVELMTSVVIAGGLFLLLAVLVKQLTKTHVRSERFTDYSALAVEVSNLLLNQQSCTASLVGTRFYGSTINLTPVSGRELWSADVSAVRVNRRFYAGFNYGGFAIESIQFYMPDYTAGINMPSDSVGVYTASVALNGKTIGGEDANSIKKFEQTIYVTVSTNSIGESEILQCGKSHNYIRFLICGTLGGTYDEPDCELSP